MSVSLNIGNLRLLDIEVYKNNEIIYRGMSDNAPEEIKQLNATKVDGISPLRLFVDGEGI